MTIKTVAHDVAMGQLDLETLKEKDSAVIIEKLISYKGIGIWTC